MSDRADKASLEETKAVEKTETASIVFSPSACVLASGEECNRCQIVCPANAIEIANGEISVDAGLCTGCNICIGICDCFSSPRVTTYDFAHRIKRKALEHEGVVLCCSEDVFEGLEPDANVVVVPCLSDLSAELLTFLLAHGCKLSLAHDDSYCTGCKVGGAYGGKLWKRALALAQEWADVNIERIDEIPEKQDFLAEIASPDRRGLFTAPLAAATDVASGRYRERTSNTIDAFLARRELQRARLQAMNTPEVFLDDDQRRSSIESKFTRKRLMQEACKARPDISDRINR